MDTRGGLPLFGRVATVGLDARDTSAGVSSWLPQGAEQLWGSWVAAPVCSMKVVGVHPAWTHEAGIALSRRTHRPPVTAHEVGSGREQGAVDPADGSSAHAAPSRGPLWLSLCLVPGLTNLL